MENKELKFKTNLNCGGCVAKIKADLDNLQGVSHWQVDTGNADKILTLYSTGVSSQQVVSIITSKGFKAEPMTH